MTMRARSWHGLAAGLGVAGLLACGKGGDKKQSAGEPAAAEENREKAAQLTAPASLFGHIPADTPYVFASFEPLPAEYLERIKPQMKAFIDELAKPTDAPPTSPPERFMAAVMRDMRANFDEAGAKKIFGVTMASRYALYGIGVVPVMRVELADSKALLASIERWQSESGLALPTASVEGRSYWRFAESDVVVVAAVAGDHLVFSAGPTDMVDEALPFILGVKQPAPNMADGAPLKAVAGKHGFPGIGLGYVDTGNLLKLLAMANFFQSTSSSEAIKPGCMEELRALSVRFPRLVFGYDAIDAKRAEGRFIVETDAALAGRLKQLAVEVPGLGAGLPPDRPLFTLGLGIDLDKARQLMLDAVAGIERLGGACEGDDVGASMAQARAFLTQPLPPGLDTVRGLVVSLVAADIGPGGKPDNMEMFAIIASSDPAALMGLAKGAVPAQVGDIPADGKFHDVVPAGSIPNVNSTLRAAIKPKAVVVAAGERGASAAEAALERTGTSPLLYFSMDYGKFMSAVLSSTGLGSPEKAIADVMGVMATWAYPTDHGLAWAFSMEIR